MHWLTMWGWLVNAGGFWKSVIGWAVFAVLTWAATWLPWRRHRKTQARIADSLDTRTDGGLKDVMDAINRLEKPDEADR
jgi:hypothetical protein